MCRNRYRRRERGISLVELIVFIVVVAVAVIGVLGAFGLGARTSADPMVLKQALAIAEALMEEVQLQPFTYCDPDDPNAASAASAADCTVSVEGLGPETNETRTGTEVGRTPFDNVNDYNGLTMPRGAGAGIKGIDDVSIAGLEQYEATVSVTNQAVGGVPSSDALLIRVTVNGPVGTGVSVVLDGYRVRYAPNAPP